MKVDVERLADRRLRRQSLVVRPGLVGPDNPVGQFEPGRAPFRVNLNARWREVLRCLTPDPPLVAGDC